MRVGVYADCLGRSWARLRLKGRVWTAGGEPTRASPFLPADMRSAVARRWLLRPSSKPDERCSSRPQPRTQCNFLSIIVVHGGGAFRGPRLQQPAVSSSVMPSSAKARSALEVACGVA
jgi:hypothetical protein